MATWANLTQEQRDVWTAWEKQVRAAAGELQLLCNKFEILNDAYDAQILAILTDLDDNTVVPNASGLAGSSSLDSDAETVLLRNHMNGILTTYNTEPIRELRVKAAGVNAMV